MPTINELSSTSTLASGDQIPVYDASEGDARKASLSTLLTWFQNNFASPEFETVTAAPTSSGSTVALDATSDSIWLILNPTGAFAALTIQLPPEVDCFDGQQIIVVCSNSVGTLTIDDNGAAVVGAPSSLGTDGFFALRFRKQTGTWYCVAQSLGATDSFTDITLSGDILAQSGDIMLDFIDAGGTPAPGENNRLTVVYSANGDEVGLAAQGDSTNIDIGIQSKGTTGSITLNAGNASGGVVTLDAHTVNILPDAAGVVNLGGGGDVAISTTTTGANISITAGDGNVAITAIGGDVFIPSPLTLTDSVTFPVNTVATLPGTPVQGMRAIVTNANATTFHSIVAGGGANVVPVFYDGTNWRIG